MAGRPRPKTVTSLRVGRRVAEERIRRGWTCADLALKIGIHHSVEGKIERGDVALTAERIALYAEIFGVPIGTLFEERGVSKAEAAS